MRRVLIISKISTHECYLVTHVYFLQSFVEAMKLSLKERFIVEKGRKKAFNAAAEQLSFDKFNEFAFLQVRDN